VLDQQPGVAALALHRRVRRGPARAQLEVEPELLHDLRRQQADQVRVARQPGLDPGERLLAHRRAADVVEPLEHQRAQAGAGQVGGRDQPVVPAADDHRVVPLRLCAHADEATGRRSLPSAPRPDAPPAGPATVEY
jgi:hypothetical protein